MTVLKGMEEVARLLRGGFAKTEKQIAAVDQGLREEIKGSEARLEKMLAQRLDSEFKTLGSDLKATGANLENAGGALREAGEHLTPK